MTIKAKITLEDNTAEYFKRVKRVTDRASRDAARMVLTDARRLVPKDTGRLASQIEVQRGKYPSGDWEVIAQPRGSYGDKFYAIFVELGTIDTPTQPYMRPALKKNNRKIKNMIQRALD